MASGQGTIDDVHPVHQVGGRNLRKVTGHRRVVQRREPQTAPKVEPA
jgi:hypothetical protein